MKSIKRVLLVDDDPMTNLINEKIIHFTKGSSKVGSYLNPGKALDYLKKLVKNDSSQFPNVLFLDINMPGMNGWEFMEAYDQIEEKMKANVVITMLTTSIADSDKELAMKRSDINAYENKPLTEKKLWNILEKFFPERFVDEE